MAEELKEVLEKQNDFIAGLLYKLAVVIGLNDGELQWLIDHGYKIDDGEYKRITEGKRNPL